MSKHRFIVLLFTVLLVSANVPAQLSHGGEPLPPTMLRSADAALFVEMEPFDTASLLEEDSIAAIHHRAARFAKKFSTDIRPENAGIHFTTADGMRVWQCGIRSKGAFSINLLFTEFRLPEGAKLFIYSRDRSHKIGAFTADNNNQYNQLPTAPVAGDEVVVEYQEPFNAAFRGKLAIGEVNHDYRGVTLRGRPGALSTTQTCHRDAICYPQYENQAQATTLLIINGNEYCSGCLMNNIEQDGTPYLLSAAHCFLPRDGATSEERALHTVIFFNYQSPTCQTTMVGTEQQSLASAELVANEKSTDIALLKLAQKPPRYYRPYYAGWNAGKPGDGPYFGIHHPMSKTKKILTSETSLTNVSYDSSNMGYSIEPGIHLLVDTWLDGTTEGGSSGSPLFDSNKRVIGALTGGASYCSDPRDDYYYSLQKVWDYYPEANRQLKHWLDPKNSGQFQVNGFDPYVADSPCVRISNVAKNETFGVSRLDNAGGPVFGQNSLQLKEFAERFITAKKTTVYGFNFVLPNWKSSQNGKVTFRIYSGYSTPDQLLSSTTLNLSYFTYSLGSFKTLTLPNTGASDHFIKLDSPVTVDYSFFISYQISYPPTDTFAIYNVTNRVSHFNSTLVNDIPYGWKEMTDFASYPMKTSLWIDPTIYLGDTATAPINTTSAAQIIFDKTSRILYFKGLTPLSVYRLRMYNPAGALVIDKNILWQEAVILSRERNGVYLINLVGDDKVIRQKVVVSGSQAQ